jgi:ABC-2 type transport system permease protein
MKLYRIYALSLRYFITIPRNLYRMVDLVYYPLLDIALWGSVYISHELRTHGTIPTKLGIESNLYLAALVLWSIASSINVEIAFNVLEELYAQNVISLLTAPFLHSEWVIAMIILSMVKVAFTLIFCSCVIWLFYGLNVFSFGLPFIYAIALTALFGLILGLFLTAFVINWGKRIDLIYWTIPYLVLFVSCVLYPLALLPRPVQFLSKILPTTYVFEGLRTYIQTGSWPSEYFSFALLLSIAYLAATLWFLRFMLKKSTQKGLTLIEGE